MARLEVPRIRDTYAPLLRPGASQQHISNILMDLYNMRTWISGYKVLCTSGYEYIDMDIWIYMDIQISGNKDMRIYGHIDKWIRGRQYVDI